MCVWQNSKPATILNLLYDGAFVLMRLVSKTQRFRLSNDCHDETSRRFAIIIYMRIKHLFFSSFETEISENLCVFAKTQLV